jgi:hypothetical protein
VSVGTQSGQARGDPLGIPGIGTAAAAFLTSGRGWTSRHVEHFELLDETSARRRLTVDLRLSEASTVAAGETNIYFVPVAVIAKDEPVDHVDLRDEDGGALPLLTRQENAALSEAAICVAARQMAGMPLGDEVQERLHRIAWESPTSAGQADRQPPRTQVGREVTRRLVQHEFGPRFARFVARLVEHSVLWVPLDSSGGITRIVKLTYETPVAPAIRFVSTALILEQPHVPDSGSYHLQVTAPPGLETRSLRLEAERAIKRPDQRRVTYLARTSRGAHLYLEGVRLEKRARVTFTLRLSRSGFLSSAMVASVFIVLLLAAFAACSTSLSRDPEVSVAILVVVPALLVAFAVREEHALARSLLRGARYLLVFSGLLAVGAALALAGFRPFGLDLHAWWLILALLAGLDALGLLMMWLAAGRAIRRAVETDGVLVQYGGAHS